MCDMITIETLIMKAKLFTFLLLVILFFNSSLSFAQKNHTLTSPNNEIHFTMSKNSEMEWQYEISYKNKQVIQPSNLGLELGRPYNSKKDIFPSSLELKGTSLKDIDTVWVPLYGEKNQYIDYYKEAVFSFGQGNENDLLFQIVVRAYNEGIAFRYFFPENAKTQISSIFSERTTFSFPKNSKGWFISAPQKEYEPLPTTSWESSTVMPFTVKVDKNTYISIAEAAASNYPFTTLEPVTSGEVQTSLFGIMTETSPFNTPWRVVMVADSPGKLLENNSIVLNLNPENKIEDTWWIKPGKVIREVTLSTTGAKKLVDFCYEQNMDYVHFDAGWYGYEYHIDSDATTVTVDPRRNPKGDLDLPEAIRYAKSKGIGVFLYVNHRALEHQLDEILPIFQKWGVDGIKFGFVHTGTHRWRTWLHDAIKKCAKYQLMVNVHDNYIPSGFSRTYPNLMTQEGIRGNEEMPDATHNATLPYTRFLAGAADYTMCYYYRKEFGHEKRHVKTSPVHQLALPVIFYSPLQWLYWYDRPYEDYQGEPELEFWKNIPTTWDDTKVLSGEIGEHISIVRKKSNEWFGAAITNNDGGELSFPLSFLEKGKWEVTIYSDGGEHVKTRTHVAIEKQEVIPSDELKFTLQPSGGIALHFILKREE